MNKKALILALSLAMLTGCGNKTEETTTSNEQAVTSTEISNQDTSSSETVEKEGENKMIGGEEKGEGNITLATPGGEGSEVSLIVKENTMMTQIGFNAEGVDVDGNEPTKVYVDGNENTQLQLSKDVKSQEVIDLKEDELKPGIHNVEVVQEKDGEQTFYRLLTYEVK